MLLLVIYSVDFRFQRSNLVADTRPGLSSAESSFQDGSTPLEVARHQEVRRTLLKAVEDKIQLSFGGGAGTLAAALRSMREQGQGLDVTLRCSGGASSGGAGAGGEGAAAETVRCHRVVLAAQGDFWRTLCFGPMARRDHARIRAHRGILFWLRLADFLFCETGLPPSNSVRCVTRDDGTALRASPSSQAGRHVRDRRDICGHATDSRGLLLQRIPAARPVALRLPPALLRAAHRFLMPQLLAACRVRLVGTIAAGDEALFAVYGAAAEIGDEGITGLVRRFLLRNEAGRAWLESLVADAEAWRRLTVAAAAEATRAQQEGAVAGPAGPEAAQVQPQPAVGGGEEAAGAGAALLRELVVLLLRGEGPGGEGGGGDRKRKREGGGGSD